MTDPTATPPQPGSDPGVPEAAEVPAPADDAAPAPAGEVPSSQMPEYKGEPLDAGRGPGLGCFWIQIGLLTFFLVFTPLTVTWGWDPLISGALLIFTLILLLFSGQTIIFLLRLVAADRRTRRTPLDPKAKRTVGQMEDASGPPEAPQSGTEIQAEAEAETEPAEKERTDG